MAKKNGLTRVSEKELRELAKSGLSTKEIAGKIGRPHSYVAAAASLMGISIRDGRAGRDSRVPLIEVSAMLAKGERMEDISKALGSSIGAIRKALKRAGLPSTPREVLKAMRQ